MCMIVIHFAFQIQTNRKADNHTDRRSQGTRTGVDASPNYVLEPDDVPSGSTTDAANGPAGHTTAGPWSSDAFNWLYLVDGGPMDIGVDRAHVGLRQ